MDPNKQGPIGIMDSGLGGLSIWKSVVDMLPEESTVYVGDHKFIPYNSKNTSTIRDRVDAILTLFESMNCKLAVIACNTATVAGIETYRRIHKQFPIIGVVPVVKTAAAVSKKRRFAVLSTEYTARSKYQKDLIEKYASDCKVNNIGCPNLVGLVERGETDSDAIREELESILQPLKNEGIDVLALGCTHYAFLRQIITDIVGNDVSLLDSSGAVSRHAARIIHRNKNEHHTTSGKHRFLTTGDAKEVSRVATILMKKHLHFESVSI